MADNWEKFWSRKTEWVSPPEELDKKLKAIGVSNFESFAHQYKYPKGSDAETYEFSLNHRFMIYVSYERGDSDLEAYKGRIETFLPARKAELRREYENFIKENEELRRIPVDASRFGDMFHVLYGATSKFPPEDINHYLHGKRREGDSRNQGLRDVEIPGGAGWVMSPESRAKLSKILNFRTAGKRQERYDEFMNSRYYEP